VLERAFDADDNLSEDTKRFIDRHVTRRKAAVRAVGAPGHRSREYVASRGTKDRHVRRKKAPAAPGLLRRGPVGAGVGGTAVRAY
jgi:hypothetical protein